MFKKKFRFEDMIEFQSPKLEREFKIKFFNRIRNNLQKVRMLEILET